MKLVEFEPVLGFVRKLLFERWGEDQGFHFSFAKLAKVDASQFPFGTGSEIHTIVTYDHETHFDVNKKRFGRSVWQELSFEVHTLETQNWKHNFLDIWVRFLIAVEKVCFWVVNERAKDE